MKWTCLFKRFLYKVVRDPNCSKCKRSLASWWQSPDHNCSHTKALRKEKSIMGDEQAQQQEVSEDTQDRKKPQFGTRYLTDPKNVFQHNTWDNVVWGEEQEVEAREKTLQQMQHLAPVEKQEEYERDADQFWNKFYNQHQNRFFKDRHWLFTEFPELYSSVGPSDALVNADTDTSSSYPTTTSGLTKTQPDGISEKPDEQSDAAKLLSHCVLTEKQDSLESSPVVRSSEDYCKRDFTPGSNADSVNSKDGSQRASSVQFSSLDSQARDGATFSHTQSFEGGESFPGEKATFKILEVGCGVGNTVFPVLTTNKDPGLMVYCCDFSNTAVQLVKEHRDYEPQRCHAFVWDITDESSPLPFPPASLDVVIMIFVLSSLHPDKMQGAVNRLASCLKPGGQLLMRDYGRYDMAQLRFKNGRCLAENFYVRGDGTRVYFFTQEELRLMLTRAGLVEVQNLIDRRLQVNRGRQLKMYRVWIQCKYRKPQSTDQAKGATH